jgi:hypothetical protein
MSHAQFVQRFAIALVVFFLTVPALASETHRGESSLEAYQDADGYLIYALLLKSEKHAYPVVQAEMDFFADAAPGKMGIRGGRGFRKEWGATLKDFAAHDRLPMLIARAIPSDIPYHLLPKAEIEAIFKAGGGWNQFYKDYPASGGYISFSPVGFDPGKTHAIVDMNLSCGSLCGHLQPRFFKKINGEWSEVSVKASIWMTVS